MLARGFHRHVLALEIALFGPAAAAQEEEPRAVDGPVAEGAVAGEEEGARGEGVGEVVADCGWGVLVSGYCVVDVAIGID